MTRRPRLLAAVVLAAASAALAGAVPDSHGVTSGGAGGDAGRHGGTSYDVGLWGDLPYTPEQETTGVPDLIADMNRARLAFTIFDGDIKNGSTPCTDQEYAEAEARFDTLRAPAIYVPGDNEWTDCHRTRAGGYDPLERLGFLRGTLFDEPLSFGRRRMAVERQDANYPEHLRWSRRGVVFVTLNVQGSNNNRIDDVDAPESNSTRTPADRTAANAEYEAREPATIAWLRDAFDEARRQGGKGLMGTMQADPGFEVTDPAERAAAGLNGFDALLAALREETIAFDRPVALVHGDSHLFRIDKPLRDAAGVLLENFTRVETFGELDPHWVRATIDPRDPDVFRFRAEIVDENAAATTTG